MPRLRVTRNSVTGAAVAAVAAAPAAIDPYFEQTRLLLHMDGSNGSVSVVDNSSYAHVISTNGNAQISTAQSKFGGSSLDTSAQGYLSVPMSSAFDLAGSFTIEAWIRINAFTGSDYQVIARRWGASSDYSFIFWLTSTKLELAVGNDGSYSAQPFASYSFQANTWYHVAACRNGTTLRFFVNGSLIGSATSAANLIGTSAPLLVGETGSYLNGYVDDLRITAAARYTSAFTVPTEAFPDGPMPTAWTPELIGNQVGWWDATATPSFTYATGSNVSSWASRTGSYALSQATASSQPTRSGTINGKTSVLFDGVNDFLSVANFDLTAGGQASSIWFAGYYNGGANVGTVAQIESPTCALEFQSSNALYAKTDANGTTALVNSANINASALIAIGTTDGSLSTNETTCWINGTGTGNTYGNNANTNSANSISALHVGRRTAATGYLPGQIAEMGVIAGVISTSDRQKLEGYLAHRWGISSKLPSDHPYKTAAPTIPASSYDADATTYFAAVEAADGQALESGVKTAINDFIVGCKADGTWSALKASCILAGARTLAGALVPLVGTAPTNYNFVNGDYDRKTGLVGNGSTKYLESNRANNADPQNSQHLGAFITNAGTSAYGTYIGAFHNGTGSSYFYRDPGGGSILHVSRRNGSEMSTNGTILNYIGLSRASSTSYSFRMAGATSSITATSAAPTSETLNVFRINRSSSNLYMNARMTFYSIGEAIDLALLDTRLTTLMSSLATAIP